MTWRVDLILTSIFNVLGPLWLTAALAALIYVATGRLVRAMFVTIFVLVCTQVWWRPLFVFAHQLRWTLLLILFSRGLVFMMRTRAPPNEERSARRLVIVLGGLSILSMLWSANAQFTMELAISFCLGLVVTFGLLWRLADDPAVIRSMAQGALAFAFLAFGSGFLVAGVAYVTGEFRYYDATKLDWGGRYSGVFINPNAAGLIGAMLFPVIVAAPREFLGRLAHYRLPVLLLTFATIFLSGSRSALIGSAMAVVVLAMYRYGAGALVTVALGGIAVWAIAVYAPLDDIDSTAVGHISRTKHLSTLSGRLELWEQGWDSAQGHLAIGQGWGRSRALGDVDLERALEVGQVVGATNLHNAHLQLLIDVGFVGVVVFWAFCIAVLRAGWAILRAPRSSYNGLALVIFTSALAMIADTWMHGGIWSMGSPTTLAFWAICALSLKEGERARREAAGVRAAHDAWAAQRGIPEFARAPA